MLVVADSVPRALFAGLSQTLSEFAKVQRFSVVAPEASVGEGAKASLTLRTMRDEENLEIVLEFEGVELLGVETASVYLEEEFWLGDVTDRKWEDWVDVRERDWRALAWAVSTQGEWEFYARTCKAAGLRRLSQAEVPDLVRTREFAEKFKTAGMDAWMAGWEEACRLKEVTDELDGLPPLNSGPPESADRLPGILAQCDQIRQFEVTAAEGGVDDDMDVVVTLGGERVSRERLVRVVCRKVKELRFNPRSWCIDGGFRLEPLAGEGREARWLLTGGDELALKTRNVRYTYSHPSE